MNEKIAKLTPKNRFIAFVLLPLYQSVMFTIGYLFSFNISGGNGIWSFVGFLLVTFFVCFICNPVFNAFEFDNIYIENGDLTIREKVEKFKGIFIIFTVAPIIMGIYG